jgi:anti-anti-sigma factor
MCRSMNAYGDEVTVADGPTTEASPHVLLLYRDERHRQARVVSWVRDGLVHGEKILYSTVPGDPLVADLDRAKTDGVPTPRPGQLTVLSSQEIFPGARQAELVHRALDEGYPGVRLSARADAGLRDSRLEEYKAVDRLTDSLCASLPVTALCQLDARSASDETLTAVIESHSGVEDAQMRLRRRDDQVLVLSGEVDFSSAEILSRALRSLCRSEAASAVVVDLSELSFVDMAGCRALVSGTDELRSGGGGVTLTGVSSHLRRVLTLLGVDRLPGLELS